MEEEVGKLLLSVNCYDINLLDFCYDGIHEHLVPVRTTHSLTTKIRPPQLLL